MVDGMGILHGWLIPPVADDWDADAPVDDKLTDEDFEAIGVC